MAAELGGTAHAAQAYRRGVGGKKIREGTRGQRIANAVSIALFSLTLIIGISVISFSIVFFFSKVQGTSMMKTINAKGVDTDSVLVNRYTKPKQGDIIVLEHFFDDGESKELHIKRLLAIGPASIRFEKVAPAAGEALGHYNIYINGVLDDSPIFINNVENDYYDHFYNWQQTGHLDFTMRAEYRKMGTPGFRDADDKGVPFSRADYKDAEGRREIRIPSGFMFYMGDNRGGTGSGTDLSNMSCDCTFYGPQPIDRIIGVVSEIVVEKSAPRWFVDKVILVVTFGLVKR